MSTGERLFQLLYLALPYMLIVFVVRTQWRRLFTAQFRADVFSLRRKLFDLGLAQNAQDPKTRVAYDRLRQTLNGLLFEAERITWFHISVAMVWAKVRTFDSVVDRTTMDAINKVDDPNVRSSLTAMHQLMRAMIGAHLVRLIAVTPPMWPFYFLVRVRWSPKTIYESIGFTSSRRRDAAVAA